MQTKSALRLYGPSLQHALSRARCNACLTTRSTWNREANVHKSNHGKLTDARLLVCATPCSVRLQASVRQGEVFSELASSLDRLHRGL